VEQLPVQSTFWRFLGSLHLVVARQLLEVTRCMRQRVWEAAHVRVAATMLQFFTLTYYTQRSSSATGSRNSFSGLPPPA